MIEPFVLLAVGLAFICLRTWARLKAVGFKNFMADDYLMLLAIVPYTVETGLAYTLITKYKGFANNGMTDDERYTLSLEGNEEELMSRVEGSKTSIANWVFYTLLLWISKGAILAFFLRLTERLGKYRKRIYVGFFLVGATWMIVFMSLMLSCRPIYKYWQIYPDPGIYCHPAVSPINLFVTLSLNVSTDIYILAIPLPILWMANIRMWKKLGLIVLVSGNIFVITIGTLRCYLITADHETGAQQAGHWTVRVTFVSVVTTNLPLLFPPVRRLTGLLIRPVMGASRRDVIMRQLRTITAVTGGTDSVREVDDYTIQRLTHPGSEMDIVDASKHGELDDVADIHVDVSSVSEASSPIIEVALA